MIFLSIGISDFLSLCTLSFLCIPSIYTMADFTSKTLKIFLDHTCEGQSLYLHCPINTSLLINGAIYGRPAPNLYNIQNDLKNQNSQSSTMNSQHKICEINPSNNSKIVKPKDRICISPLSMEKVVNLCQDKQNCQIFASNSVFNDPCPNVFKYLQVSYKCQPSEFINKITCENREMTLKCENSQRIMLFYATYGIQNGGNIVCKNSITNSHQLKCESSNATEIIRSKCYGFQYCKILISDNLFGNPCTNLTKLHNKYLSVVYSCVNKKILRDEFVFDESHVQTKKLLKPKLDGSTNITYLMTIHVNRSRIEDNGFVMGLFGFLTLVQSNREKLVLYFATGCCLGLFLVLLFLIFRLFDHKLFNFYVLIKVCCCCAWCNCCPLSKQRHSSKRAGKKKRKSTMTANAMMGNGGNLRYIPQHILDQDLGEYNKFDHNYDSFSRFKFTSTTHPTNFEALLTPSTSEF